MNPTTGDWTDAIEEDKHWILRLFVAGASANSTRAIANIKAICEEYLKGCYELQVIDVHQEGLIARQEQIIALPMLLKVSPGPERRLIGDMSDVEKVLKGLNVYQ